MSCKHWQSAAGKDNSYSWKILEKSNKEKKLMIYISSSSFY